MYENKELTQLFDELVPPRGKCPTLGGELVRAANRLIFRFYNDGDMVGRGYGNETCNAAARFIEEMTDQDSIVPVIASSLWTRDDKGYETSLCHLGDSIAQYIRERPELKSEPSNFDMFDWGKPEDLDYDEEEEEEW